MTDRVDDRSTLLEFALALADAADAIALPAFLDGQAVRLKPDGTPVTDADTAVETMIRGQLAETYPEHGILGEELGTTGAPDSPRWIIDPIDGTVNFTRGIPIWATLIAFEEGGELQVAVISMPAIGQRWYASRGGGTTAVQLGRERAVRVSSVSSLADAHVVHAGVGAMLREGLSPGFVDILRDAARDRGFGDALGYTLVAQGSADVMVETAVKPWDLAAPALIITEAGGRFTRVDGSEGHDGPTALATNGHLHDEVLARLRG
ncbi:MAG TPA: inositol monophosphatase family protein [Candidatus Limnocylindria bacterium]